MQPINQTEQRNPRSSGIDSRSTFDMLQIMNDEDMAVPQIVRAALPQIAQAVDAIAARMAQGGRLIYVGAGTSGRLALIDAVECVPTFNTPPELVVALLAGGQGAFMQAVEGAEDDAAQGAADIGALKVSAVDSVVGIAASGRTPYVLGALDAAAHAGAITVGIACNLPSPLLDQAQIAIGLPVGAEVITGSTRLKAGTAQKLVLNMISTAVMIRLGKVYDNLMVDVKPTNRKLVDRAERITAEIGGVDQGAARRLLRECEYQVKTAVVMARFGIAPEQARERLAAAGGRLRLVLDG
ncbi:MAG: N-acetylmuramic acid 6-phosphate etherase [bacterium]|nr:N-acetylmuramic acid 6-phosphate etherase [bacterium]